MRITQPSGRISIPSYDAVRHGAEIGYANGEQNTSNQDDDKPMTAEERSYLQKLLRSKLVQTKNDIEIQRKDPNSPLYSIKSFEELNLRPELLKGIYAMGFNTPSKIQETALPTLLADPPQNMIAQSQSGTGKTAAFVLALLSRVDFKSAYPQALCLSPTYELALQTGKVVEQMGKFIENMSIAYAVRGERVSRGQKISSQIVIGTPGTVLDWTMKFHVVDLKRVRVFVLDEADVMIATQGHQDQSTRIHRGLNTASCQMMLFSATYDQQVMNFAEAIISSPMTIRLRREEESLDNIKQYYVVCGGKEDKFQALANIYGVITVGQAMIFCHTRNTTNWLAERMIKEGHAVALLNGDMQVDQRVAVLDRFRDGKEKVLITTNVCARGIDVEQVNVVVNYDLPMERNSIDCETYLHRIGRTGRFGKTGLAINLIQSRQMPMLHRIQEHFGRKIEKLDTDDADELENLA
ncbi:PREDICTED: ATP-dependent RNA helicase DDX19B-like isoform X2 [Priapulus caudatus]|nr:PREDICTED: ATP-dependent RNA helicase DDX19B-like isoform X2 [Priapulus caudatus]